MRKEYFKEKGLLLLNNDVLDENLFEKEFIDLTHGEYFNYEYN